MFRRLEAFGKHRQEIRSRNKNSLNALDAPDPVPIRFAGALNMGKWQLVGFLIFNFIMITLYPIAKVYRATVAQSEAIGYEIEFVAIVFASLQMVWVCWLFSVFRDLALPEMTGKFSKRQVDANQSIKSGNDGFQVQSDNAILSPAVGQSETQLISPLFKMSIPEL